MQSDKTTDEPAVNNPPEQQKSPRARMQALQAIPERQRTEAEWDELNELEIMLAPGNREGAPDPNPRHGHHSPSSGRPKQGGGGMPGGAPGGGPGGGHHRKQGKNFQRRRPKGGPQGGGSQGGGQPG